MLSIPLYAFLLIYFLFLVIFCLFFLINIGHLFQTAALTGASLFVAILMIAASSIVIWATWYLLQNADWQQGVTIFDSAWFSDLLSSGLSL